MIGILALKRNIDNDLPFAIHLEDARLCSGFRQHDVSVRQRLRGVHLGLGALELEDLGQIPLDLNHGTARVILVFGDGEKKISIGQDAAITSGTGVFPDRLAISVHDAGLASGGEKRVFERLGGRCAKCAQSDRGKVKWNLAEEVFHDSNLAKHNANSH